MKQLVTALALGFAWLAAADAQPVYRCGNEYTQTPCPQGRLVEATDKRSGAQRAEARRVAAGESRLAAQMQRDRLADQAAHPPAHAAALSASAAPPAKPVVAREGRSAKKKRVAAKLIAANEGIAVAPADAKKAPRRR